MYVFYREKGYSMVIKVMIISEFFFQWGSGKELFHLLTRPCIASIDQGKIYLQRFCKYKHKIAHIIYIFFTKMNIEIINMVQHNTTSMS